MCLFAALIGCVVGGLPARAGAQGSHRQISSPPAPTPITSGPRFELSLAEAVFIGLRDNRTVKSAYIERVAQKYDLFVAKTRFLPSANLVAGVQTGRVGGVAETTTNLAPTAAWLLPTGATFGFSWVRTTTTGPATSTSGVSTLTLAQPLLRGAGLRVNEAPIRVAELQDQINRLGLKSTVSETVTAIIQAYRTLLQAQAGVEIAGDSVERSKALFETNRALIAAGRMAESDLVQTQADQANQDVAALAAEQQRNSAQLALLRLLSMDLRTNIVAADPLQAQQMVIDLPRAIEIALSTRMDYLAGRKALEQDRQALIVAKNNRLWNLSVVGSLQNSRSTGVPSFSGVGTIGPVNSLSAGSSATIGLQLSIPLGDFTLAQGEVHATTDLRQAQIQLDDLQQSIEGQVRDAAQTVELSWRQFEAARQARNLAEKTLDLEREKLKVGRASNFEVLTFEAALRASQTQELAASISYLNALTILDQQLGTTLDTWRISLND